MKNEPALRLSGPPVPEDHALGRPKLDHGLRSLLQTSTAPELGPEALRQLGVPERHGQLRSLQAERDVCDNVTRCCLENARAIAETCIRRAPSPMPSGPWRSQTVTDAIVSRHFLAVRADILHRRCAGKARDTTEAFSPGQPLCYAMADERAPVLARRHVREHPVALFFQCASPSWRCGRPSP